MDRGFRYVFAYKVHYSSTGSGVADKVYPEGHPDASAWGVGTKNVLVLNSGMVDTPKQAPTFQNLPLTAQGANLTISYRYKDADHVIQYINKDSTENTSPLLNDTSTLNRITLDECNFEQEGSACEWAETSLTGVTPGTNNVVTIKANSSLYRMNYAGVENNLLIYQTPWVTTAPNINMSDTKLNIINTPELLQSNLIQIKVTDTDGNELGGLKNIIIGVELTFKSAASDAGADETATVFVNLDDELKGSIPTSNLSHLLGKKLKVDAKLISDTMGFGWKTSSPRISAVLLPCRQSPCKEITDGHFSRYYSRLSTGETSLPTALPPTISCLRSRSPRTRKRRPDWARFTSRISANTYRFH